MPVLFGAIATGTRRVLEAATRAAGHGADAVVAAVPFYVAPHQGEVLAHYAYLRARLDVPVVAYDIPSATHVRLQPGTAVALAREGDVIALKDSSGDLAGLRAILDGVAGLSFPVLSGSETLADVALSFGAAGLVPGLANIDPGGYVRLFRAAQVGDHATVALEQARLIRLFGIIDVPDRSRIGFTAGALGAFKAAGRRPRPAVPAGARLALRNASTGSSSTRPPRPYRLHASGGQAGAPVSRWRRAPVRRCRSSASSSWPGRRPARRRAGLPSAPG